MLRKTALAALVALASVLGLLSAPAAGGDPTVVPSLAYWTDTDTSSAYITVTEPPPPSDGGGSDGGSDGGGTGDYPRYEHNCSANPPDYNLSYSLVFDGKGTLTGNVSSSWISTNRSKKWFDDAPYEDAYTYYTRPDWWAQREDDFGITKGPRGGWSDMDLGWSLNGSSAYKTGWGLTPSWSLPSSSFSGTTVTVNAEIITCEGVWGYRNVKKTITLPNF